jgi:hypothetical protein
MYFLVSIRKSCGIKKHMNKQKYYTQNDNYEWIEIDPDIADNVLHQYFERRYIGAIVIGTFIIGFLLGIIAS